MKRIIICADGTWNKPEVNVAKDFPTNVLKITRLIKMGNTQIPQQIFYDAGIGSNITLISEKLYKGVTGSSLQNHVINCYRYLVHNYCPGDEIFLFGFSRGAYTVRSLCGLINNCGILKHNHANRINEAFFNYQNPHSSFQPNSDFINNFKTNYTHPRTRITFVGVWDTVGALGIPFKSPEVFYDTKMGSNIEVARHALAIDETRKKFKPTLWQSSIIQTTQIENFGSASALGGEIMRSDEHHDTSPDEIDQNEIDQNIVSTQPATNRNLIQMWFVGSHSDVGGGYPPDNDNALLSNVSLLWMIQEAQKKGLEVEEHSNLLQEKHMFGGIHNSRKHFFLLRPKYYRTIKGPNEEIHSSVFQRIEKLKYEAKNLKKYLKTNI